MNQHYLNHLFAPRSIAVVGASERQGAIGQILFNNLTSGDFQGPLYPVNPKYDDVQQRQCFASVSDIDKPVDLAVIATPAVVIPDIIRDCGEAGVRAAIVLSSGFGEQAAGESGYKLQEQLLEAAHQYGIRILGPNCLGLMIPALGMNATFSHNIAAQGNMAFVSQSGALCTAVLDWAHSEGLGFSAIASLGDAADIDFGAILSYLALDPNTHSILLYIEGIRHARSFLSGLRIAARLKPVVVVKAGRFQQGLNAAITHTGALVGNDDVFHAALRRAGAVRAYSIKQLFIAAEILSRRRIKLPGDKLAIITNGGGPGVMASDRAAELDVPLMQLNDSDLAQLNACLPVNWSQANPLDLLGDATPEHYAAALQYCLQSDKVHCVLVMLTPQAMTEATAIARTVIDAAKNSSKPVIACWMGRSQVAEAQALFREQHVPHFDTPESCIEAFAFLTSYQRNQHLLMQVPGPLSQYHHGDVEGARLIIDDALSRNRSLLSGLESRAILRAFKLPVSTAIHARTAEEALVAAETLGFPLAMKIQAPDITHKSDVGGVRLNISNANTVRSNFHEMLSTVASQQPDARLDGVTLEPMYRRACGRELMIGMVRDKVFGPAISIGAGGTMVEIMQDSFVALPPLNHFMARQMINRTRINKMLQPFREMPAINFSALEEVLLGVSEMICELPQIQELDINPLIIDDQGALVVDARIRVAYQPLNARPYEHMAIHPYPVNLETKLQLSDGTDLQIRPIRPEDANIEQEFIRRLSPQSIYFRFMHTIHELTPQMLVRFTQIDYDLEMAFIAVVCVDQEELEVGVSRYVTNADGVSCEFAVVVADEWQHKGIGMRLMGELINIARQRGLSSMEGEILAENRGMLALMAKIGFTLNRSEDDPQLMLASYRLN